MNWLKKLRFAFNAFFQGLRSADAVMLSQVSGEDGAEAEEKVAEANGGVMNDVLQKKQTQQFKELRDENYRVYRKSEEYKTEVSDPIYDSDGNIVGYGEIKTVHTDPNQEISKENAPQDILMNDGEKLILSQHLGVLIKGLGDMKTAFDDNENPDYNLKIERSFFPKFRIEKYAKKIVLKKNDTLKEHEYLVDIYCGIYPEEMRVMKGYNTKPVIDKSDVFFIQELKDLESKRISWSDITDIPSIEFVTNKAFNAEALRLYKFVDIEYLSTQKFNDSYVVSFKALALCDGFDMIEKYKTAELDAKIENKEQKTDTFIMDEFTGGGNLEHFFKDKN